MAFTTSLKWLVIKTLKAKTRKPDVWLTIQEVLQMIQYPLMLMAFMGFKATVDVPLSPSPGPIMLPWAANATPGLAMSRPVAAPNPVCGSRFSKLVFAPDLPSTRSAMALVATTLGLSNDSSCSLEGYASVATLLAAYTAPEPASAGCLHGVGECTHQQTVAAGVLFDEPSNLGNYTIAVSRDMMTYDESSKRGLSLPSLASTRTAYLGHNDGASVWLTSGFVAVQYALDRAIATLNGGHGGAAAAADWVQLTRYTLQPFRSAYPDLRLELQTSRRSLHLPLTPSGPIPGQLRAGQQHPRLPAAVGLLRRAHLHGDAAHPVHAQREVYADRRHPPPPTKTSRRRRCDSRARGRVSGATGYNLVSGMRMMGLRFSTYYLSWLLIYGALLTLAAAPVTISSPPT